MGSYQNLKTKFQALKMDYQKIQKERKIYYDTLMDISDLKMEKILDAPDIATKALVKALYEAK